MEKIINVIYKAIDGKEFDSEEVCLKYEQSIKPQKTHSIQCISISKEKLVNLEFNEKTNELPNLKEFIESNVWGNLNLFIDSWKESNDNASIEWFWSTIGTLLLNAKIYYDCFNFGMKYDCMVCTTYKNNSIPDLYEFYLLKND